MFKGLGQIPTGVWAGIVVVLAAAWIQDVWGFILGAIIIIATLVTTAYKPEEVDEETEPEDDGWGRADGPEDPAT